MKIILMAALVLVPGLVNAQVTTHNELHKAYESSINKLNGCISSDVTITRKGSLESGEVQSDNSSVTQPDYDVICDRPSTERIISMNIGGGLVSHYGRRFIPDFFNRNADPLKRGGIYDSGIRYGGSGTRTTLVNDFFASALIKYVLPAGRYELVGYYRGNGCPWTLTVNGVTNTGDAIVGTDYSKSFVIDYDGVSVTTVYTLGNEGTEQECPMIANAVELYRVNK